MLKDEGVAIMQEMKERFEVMPSNASVKQAFNLSMYGVSCSVPNWWSLLEHVVEFGLPRAVGGEPFSLRVYGLPSTIDEAGVDIVAPVKEPTFFGNYPSPDNLDVQTIDLVAIKNPLPRQPPS